MHKAQRLINHMVLLLDASGSMQYHAKQVVEVADAQIKHMAARSEEMSQETRVSIYMFNGFVECLLFDMDVMRLPSIAEIYRYGGSTALIAAYMKSVVDLKTTSQIYGDHSFLILTLTDGEENATPLTIKEQFLQYIKTPQVNWSHGFFVPNQKGIEELQKYGVDKESCEIWSVTDAAGVIKVGKKIQQVTDQFMENRAKGVRGTSKVFAVDMGVAKVNHDTVRATLQVLEQKKYTMHTVAIPGEKIAIAEFADKVLGHRHFQPGLYFYQFTKTETIQGYKHILLMDKTTKTIFYGKEARQLIGLEWGVGAKCKPDVNPQYDIFVQSTSNNRNLMAGTQVIYLKSELGL